MSNAILNDSFGGAGGIQTPFPPVPRFPVSQFGTPTGKVDTFQHSTLDLLRFHIEFSHYTKAEWEALRDLFWGLGGPKEKFLFRDDTFFEVATYTAIASFGAEAGFQFLDTRGGNSIPRYNIDNGTEVIKYDGVTKTQGVDYALTEIDSGALTFTIDPGGGEAVTAAYSFLRRCIFDAQSPGQGFAYNVDEESNYNIVLNFFEVVPDGI